MGVAIDIPVIVRALCSVDIKSDAMRLIIDAGPEVDDADAEITEFLHPWWEPGQLYPLAEKKYFNSTTAMTYLEFHRARKQEIPFGKVGFSTTPMRELFKQIYVLPQSSFGTLPVPRGKEPCTRCRLYRAVALGSEDKLRDLSQVIQGAKSVFRMATTLSIRKASSYNLLYEAAVIKEATAGLTEVGTADRTSGLSMPGAERGQVPASWRAFCADPSATALPQSSPSGKWEWGCDLTREDLSALVRGADRNLDLPHTGYDDSLDDRSIPSVSTPFIQPGNAPFLQLSDDIMDIPDLEPHQFQQFDIVLGGNRSVAGAAPVAPSNQEAAAESTHLRSFLPMPPRNYVTLPVPPVELLPVAAPLSAAQEVIDLTAGDSDVRILYFGINQC